MNLGKQIAALRKQQNMTQEALAARLGISNQAVSKWEQEQCCPDVALLPRLADIFGVSLDALFGRVPPTESAGSAAVLPWEDDGALRAALFAGHQYIGHQNRPEGKTLRFEYEGPALNVYSDFSVSCGDVEKNVSAGGTVSCGDVGGSVQAQGTVNCGDVGQTVSAGGNVACGDVGDSVQAGGAVNCGDVSGDATGGLDVSCGDVGHDASAGGGLSCGDVGGNVRAGGTVHCGDIGGTCFGGQSHFHSGD